MGKLIYFDGETRLNIPADRIIEAAKESNLESAVICGFTKEGDVYFASSLADGGDILWLIEKCKYILMTLGEDE